MIITKIVKNKLNYDIYIDEEYSFTLTDEGLYKAKLKSNTEFIITEDLNDILKEDEAKRCKNRALKIITTSSKSENKIKEKLMREGYSEYAIEIALDFLREYKFTNDERLAKNLANQSLRKNSSILQTKQNLRNKGIKKEDIEKALEEVDEDDEIENAINIANKKYRTIKNKDRDEILKKIAYTLNYRGFSYRAVDKAIQNIKNKLNENEE